jgi:hypothetical protein
MARTFAMVSRSLMSLGVALLVFSLVLVPANPAVGNGGHGHGCPGNKCSHGCHTKLCFKMYACDSRLNCLCDRKLKGCDDCKCAIRKHDCDCINKK